MHTSRRTFLTLGLAAAATAALPACASQQQAGTEIGDSRLEVFSAWTGPGFEEGLAALIDLFKGQYPEIEFINSTVAGSASIGVLHDRLADGDPPDAYQVHAGLELASDVRSNHLEDLRYLFDKHGWGDKIRQGLDSMVQVNGGIYAVPLNVHRANMLWYNPKTLAIAGLSGPPKTWEELLAQSSALRARDIMPVTVGPDNTLKHLLECVLLGELGAEAYRGLWDASTDWKSPKVQSALSMFMRVLSISDRRQPPSDWVAMADKIIKGQAAYLVLGDWVNAYLAGTQKLAFKNQYDAITSPGSQGVFSVVLDAFALPKGAKHRQAAERWLTMCASPEAQDLFNPLKGSIPAMVNTDRSRYKGYQATAMADWQDSTIKVVGSLTHGAVATSAWNTEIDKALARFVEDGDAVTFGGAVSRSYEGTK